MSAPHDEHPDLLAVATTIARGEPVDWDTAERTTENLGLLEELRVLDSLSKLADAVPDTWGRLTIAGEIGRGSHGTVYRAHDPDLGLDIALKVVRPHGPAGLALAASALTEARLLAQVNHPNVVRIFRIDTDGDEVGIAMELVPGRTVREALRKQGAFDPAETVAIGRHLCQALSAVHRARLVHGDIKAGNVMLAPDGRTVLMDFGVGCDQKVRSTAASGRAGTPLYQAPELFEGHEPSPQSDIYGLGVLLFHMLTGRYPIDAKDAAEVERHHRERLPRRRLEDLRPDLPARLTAVVNRAMAERPADRFRTAAELDGALAASLASQPTIPLWLQLGAATAVIVAAIAAYVGWGQAPPASSTTAAGPPPATSRSAPADAYQIEAAFYRHEGGRDVRLGQGARVVRGDSLSLQIRSSVPVYAYVINEDDQGESFLLFPLPDQELANPLPPGTRHEIPGLVRGEKVRWEVSSAGGREHFVVFASPERPSPAFLRMFEGLRPSTFGGPVVAHRMADTLVGALRGVGGLSKAPPAGPGPALSATYGTPLSDVEESARGWWIRQLTLDNPVR